MRDKKITIILADDHNLVRRGIISLLEDDPGIYVLAEACNGRELMMKYFDIRPDVIVTDISMPFLSGIAAVEKIKQKDKNAKALFLTVYDSEEFIYKALKAGGLGLINKSITKDELILAIESVYNGEIYIKGANGRKDLNKLLAEWESEYGDMVQVECDLSDRELDILRLVCDGYQSSEIADKLYISKKTVDSYRSSLMRKFKVSSSAQMIKYAFVHKLV